MVKFGEIMNNLYLFKRYDIVNQIVFDLIIQKRIQNGKPNINEW